MTAEVLLDIETQVCAGMAELGLETTPRTLQSLVALVKELTKWNRTYNLTAIRDEERIVSHHLLDSLVLAQYIEHGRVLDVGTGGGFPGLPLAIIRPSCEVTLLDSSQKKTAFVRDAVATLRLQNCTVVCERVEQWRAPQLFDWVVSRAFSELGQFVQVAAHLLAPEGVFVAMKGTYPADEIARLPEGFRVREVKQVAVPGLDAERHLVFVERA